MRTYEDYKSKLFELIDKHGLSHHKDKIIEIARDNIILRKTEKDDYSELGNSRLGGYPDLPEGMEWPMSELTAEVADKGKFCQFVGQINLSDIASFQDKLPEKGMLYFFIGSNSYYGYIGNENKEDAKIIYYPGKIENVEIYSLVRKDLVLEADEDDPDLDEDSPLKNPYRVSFEKSISLPYWGDIIFKQNMDIDNNDYEVEDPIETDKYENLYQEYMEFQRDDSNNELLTTMFGYIWSDITDVRENAGLDNGRVGTTDNWEILLNFQSDYDIGFNFGDYGFFYFLVHKDDLEELDFSLVETGFWPTDTY